MIRIAVLRRKDARQEPFWQTFLYEPREAGETVADALRALNAREDLRDEGGRQAEPIRWECSCLQKRCGACAMVINGRPGLACAVRLSELGGEARLAPLRKFPPVADLIVDRTAMFEALQRMRVWLEGEASPAGKQASLAAAGSRCLQCGCCLEVCPNWAPGEDFAGLAGAVPLARLLAQMPDDQRRELMLAWRGGVYGGCGRSLACRNICPAGIDADDLLARSTAIAVWKRLPRAGAAPKGEDK